MIAVSAHKQILRTSGRCFNCLRKGHLGRHCRSPGRCQRCKAKHHTSICELTEQKGDRQPPSSAATSKTSANTSTTLNPDAPLYTPTSSNHANCSDNRRTASADRSCVLYNPSNPVISLEARLMFDTGSQKSYITERARSLLSLESSEAHNLSIATFGSTSEQTKVCPIVHVGMQLRDCP